MNLIKKIICSSIIALSVFLCYETTCFAADDFTEEYTIEISEAELIANLQYGTSGSMTFYKNIWSNITDQFCASFTFVVDYTYVEGISIQVNGVTVICSVAPGYSGGFNAPVITNSGDHSRVTTRLSAVGGINDRYSLTFGIDIDYYLQSETFTY